MLKDHRYGSQWMDGGSDHQPNLTQSSSSSSKSVEAKQSTKISAFIGFLDATSIDSTNNRLTHVISKDIDSIAGEFVLCKSIANKEVEKVVRENQFHLNQLFQLQQIWCVIYMIVDILFRNNL